MTTAYAFELLEDDDEERRYRLAPFLNEILANPIQSVRFLRQRPSEEKAIEETLQRARKAHGDEAVERLCDEGRNLSEDAISRWRRTTERVIEMSGFGGASFSR
jgi:hypothetical protein